MDVLFNRFLIKPCHSTLTVTERQKQLISACRHKLWTVSVCIVPWGSNHMQMWSTYGSWTLVTQTLTLNEFRGCKYTTALCLLETIAVQLLLRCRFCRYEKVAFVLDQLPLIWLRCGKECHGLSWTVVASRFRMTILCFLKVNLRRIFDMIRPCNIEGMLSIDVRGISQF